MDAPFPPTSRLELEACIECIRLAAARQELGELVLNLRQAGKPWSAIRAELIRRTKVGG